MCIHLVSGLSGCGKSTVIKCLCARDDQFVRLSFSETSIYVMESKFGITMSKAELPAYLSQQRYYDECLAGFVNLSASLSREQCVLLDSGASANQLKVGLHFPVNYGFDQIKFDGLIFIKSRPSEIFRRVERSTESHRIPKYDEYFVGQMQSSLELGMHVRASSLGIPMAVIVNDDVEDAVDSLFEAATLSKRK